LRTEAKASIQQTLGDGGLMKSWSDWCDIIIKTAGRHPPPRG
jgi:hypothetical protein